MQLFIVAQVYLDFADFTKKNGYYDMKNYEDIEINHKIQNFTNIFWCYKINCQYYFDNYEIFTR